MWMWLTFIKFFNPRNMSSMVEADGGDHSPSRFRLIQLQSLQYIRTTCSSNIPSEFSSKHRIYPITAKFNQILTNKSNLKCIHTGRDAQPNFFLPFSFFSFFSFDEVVNASIPEYMQYVPELQRGPIREDVRNWSVSKTAK